MPDSDRKDLDALIAAGSGGFVPACVTGGDDGFGDDAAGAALEADPSA